MAAALDADVCEIFTDVDGIFTADPRVVPSARLISEIAYEDMLELAASGAGVLMMRSVEFARRFGVPLHVRSSFHEGPGTWVKESVMEEAIVSGVAHDTSEAKITVHGVPDQPGVAARLFGTLADADINVDMIVQNVSMQGVTDISFTVPKSDAEAALAICEKLVPEFKAGGADVDLNVARVSVVGAGMRSNPGIAAGMFKALGEKGINIHMISTSAIRISCVIDDEMVDEAVRTLHDQLVPLDEPVEEHA
jgi:aspartate kinase